MIPLTNRDIFSDPVQLLEELTDSTSKHYNPLMTKLLKVEYGSIEAYMKSESFQQQIKEYKEKIRSKPKR